MKIENCHPKIEDRIDLRPCPLLQPLGGCKGMYLLDCKSINHSNHDNEIGVPVFEPSSL